jgi:hypothetical protein
MVAIAAEIVHFLPQLVTVRFHFGEVCRNPSTSASSIESLRLCSSLLSLVDSAVASRIPGTLPGRLRIDACIGEIRADLWRCRLVIIAKRPS